jgi:putative PIN family toxin of toxin-antitoxin system
MRAVIDTNILVRALIMPHGSMGPILLRLCRGDYTLLYGQSMLEELIDVLNRPRIKKYGITDDDIQTVVCLILLRGEAVTLEKSIITCRNPKDDKFLEAAVTGKADVIVNGDQDLLVLNPFVGIPIIQPSEFLKMLDG